MGWRHSVLANYFGRVPVSGGDPWNGPADTGVRVELTEFSLKYSFTFKSNVPLQTRLMKLAESSELPPTDGDERRWCLVFNFNTRTWMAVVLNGSKSMDPRHWYLDHGQAEIHEDPMSQAGQIQRSTALAKDFLEWDPRMGTNDRIRTATMSVERSATATWQTRFVKEESLRSYATTLRFILGCNLASFNILPRWRVEYISNSYECGWSIKIPSTHYD